MSQPAALPTCSSTTIAPTPCVGQLDPKTQTYGPCQPTIPKGSTGLVLQNYMQENVIANPLQTNASNPMCFTILGFTQDPTQPKQEPQVMLVVIPSQSPVEFAFYGAVTGSFYGTATSSATPPSQPFQINSSAPAPSSPVNVPTNFQPPDIRKNKPIWVLIIAAALFLLSFVLLIVMGVVRNNQVLRVYGDLKGAKDDESRELIAEDEGLEAEYSDFRGTYLIVIGAIGIAIVIGLVVGALFLPGYPLSKYMNYEGCQSLAAKEPSNQWSWSIPPESGIWSFLCKTMGACICRSLTAESNCFNYAVTMPSYSPNVWQGALKNPPASNKCLCCDGSICATIVNNEPQPC